MEEQPVPHDHRWPWPTTLWSMRRGRAGPVVSVRVERGVREYCVQCGEMIFADKLACVVTREIGQKWLTLHFHRACYIVWERMERSPPVDGRE